MPRKDRPAKSPDKPTEPKLMDAANQPSRKDPDARARHKRLSAALRANLRRRKAAAKPQG